MATPEPSIFDQVDEDAEAGRVVPHRRVRDWLKSIGTPAQSETPYS